MRFYLILAGTVLTLSTGLCIALLGTVSIVSQSAERMWLAIVPDVPYLHSTVVFSVLVIACLCFVTAWKYIDARRWKRWDNDI